MLASGTEFATYSFSLKPVTTHFSNAIFANANEYWLSDEPSRPWKRTNRVEEYVLFLLTSQSKSRKSLSGVSNLVLEKKIFDVLLSVYLPTTDDQIVCKWPFDNNSLNLNVWC